MKISLRDGSFFFFLSQAFSVHRRNNRAQLHTWLLLYSNGIYVFTNIDLHQSLLPVVFSALEFDTPLDNSNTVCCR